MTLIFPGSSIHNGFSGASRTEYLVGLARDLASSSGKISEHAQSVIDLCLLVNGHTPGPLHWRGYIERACGGDKQVIKLLAAAEGVLTELARNGAKPLTVASLAKVAEDLSERLSDLPTHAEDRFRWLLNDMIQRLPGSPAPESLGNINCRVDEAAGLAVLLGFESVPVQRFHYSRDADCTLSPWLGRVWPNPLGFVGIRKRHPEYVHVFGYRLHDPVAGGAPVDVTYSVLAETDDRTKPAMYDLLTGKSMTRQRDPIRSTLDAWIRELEGRRVGRGQGWTVPRVGSWQPPPGTVGTKAICSEPRFRKAGKSIPRTTLDVWLKKHPTEKVFAPDSGELFLLESWVQARIVAWHPRKYPRT